jgi:catechol 2,3-dioxygenase-like lactoylglutathione lyase family enzyme
VCGSLDAAESASVTFPGRARGGSARTGAPVKSRTYVGTRFAWIDFSEGRGDECYPIGCHERVGAEPVASRTGEGGSAVSKRPQPRVRALDHIVLTVTDIDATCAWYERLLGMSRISFETDRTALTFERQKINLHRAGEEVEPHAARPGPGTADLCFIVADPLADVIEFFQGEEVEIEHGPVEQSGAVGVMDSIYVRDPDGNLIEVASYR